MSDTPPGTPAEERLRAAHARLRQVVEAKDAEIGALKAAVAAQKLELAAELAAGDARVDERIAALEAELAKLRAQIAKNSANFSIRHRRIRSGPRPSGRRRPRSGCGPKTAHRAGSRAIRGQGGTGP